MEKRVASRILLMMLSLQALLLVAGLSTPAATTVAVAGGSGEDMGGAIRLPSDTASGERPWKCCDLQTCTKSIPAFCRCRDLLEQCSDACKECGKVRDSDPPRYICQDVYRGIPAPMCHEHQGRTNQVVVVHAEMAAVVRGSKKGENGKGRPWKCCDKAVPGPTTEGQVWYCMDKVDKCTCNRCFELEGSHRYYYCLDGYQGSDPGPSCTTHA
ncbi:Bowman-Birk type trypsin inhibitor isoform X2 [Setaria italica]|uniref:Bowman-Birk type trypsin inhibitor isoform X2 n=1 Tax=Setaria italica TaxID=4555 RepID=UPI000646DEB7|nr:Bowman-Birk type trypsin inhibitor isoform X2 [Setaria italica]XP_034597108.1 Bowman-Birk type trypsin inhibitor-like isoform X2 [Setaria viridis]